MKNRLTKLSLIVLTALFSVSASAQLKDGDYNAESKGVWGSPIKVNLSIKNGKIADVKFTHNETPAVGGSALDKIKADYSSPRTLMSTLFPAQLPPARQPYQLLKQSS